MAQCLISVGNIDNNNHNKGCIPITKLQKAVEDTDASSKTFTQLIEVHLRPKHSSYKFLTSSKYYINSLNHLDRTEEAF